MILANPQMENIIELQPGKLQTLIIENRRFFRYLVGDILSQVNGGSGDCVLSHKEIPLKLSAEAEVLDGFANFSLNRKSLQSKILTAMEQRALSGELYAETSEILSNIEAYIADLASEFDAELVCSKISVGNLLKMAGITPWDIYDNPLERILDYMELVREFDRDKLFIFINLRAYFEDEELKPFFDSLLVREYRLLCIDCFAGEYLPGENRLVVDADLCEF